MSQEQAFALECSVLYRLNETEKRFGTQRFPALCAIDLDRFSITMDYVGTSLDALSNNEPVIVVESYREQLREIVMLLQKANVVHLDLYPGHRGRNVCVTESGRLSLIDFDICMIDSIIMSPECEKRLKHVKEHGGYEYIYNVMELALRDCRGISLKN